MLIEGVMIINIYVSDSNLTYNLQLIVWLDIFNVLVFVIFFNIHIWNNVYLPHRLYPCIYVSFQYMLPCTLGISSTSLSSLCARIPVSLHPCISVSLYALCIPVTLYHCISEPLYPALYLCLLYLCIPVFLYPCIRVSNRIYIYLFVD